ASLSLKFPAASCCCGSISLAFPIVVGVSECAQALGSSCSVMGATGPFVAGGAWATARAGASSTAIVKARLRPQTIARSLFGACTPPKRSQLDWSPSSTPRSLPLFCSRTDSSRNKRNELNRHLSAFVGRNCKLRAPPKKHDACRSGPTLLASSNDDLTIVGKVEL